MFKQVKLISLFPILLIFCLTIGAMANLFGYHNPAASYLVLSLSLMIGLGVHLLGDRYQPSRSQMMKLAFGTIGMILVIQLFILHFFPASVFHDPFRVLSQAELVSRHQFDWSNSTYFWRYPNNVPLVFILAHWFQFTSLFGLSTNVALQLLSLILLDGFIALSLITVIRKQGHRTLFFFLLFFFLVSPFAYTYYLQVFYSDLPTLLFLLVCVNILDGWPTYRRRQKYGYGLILFLSMLTGQLIKPNLIVMPVAILICVILSIRQNRALLKPLLIPFLIIVAGIGMAFPTNHVIATSVHYTPKSQYTLPATSWIWMSYNPNHRGTYVKKDIQKMTKLPNRSARAHYLSPALVSRLKKLGPTGVAHRWLTKLWVLLGTGKIQKSYTAGFIQSPLWYRSWAQPISFGSSIIMRASFVVFYLNAIMACFSLLKTPVQRRHLVATLTTILAIGYIAFHVLIWETESRYGQVLLPLLTFLIAQSDPVMVPSRHLPANIRGLRPRLFLMLTLGAATVGILITNSIPFISHRNPVIATQSSELSLQYGAKLQTVDKNAIVSQDINIAQPARSVSLSMPIQSSFTAILINTQTHQSYQFTRMAHRLKVRHFLPAGKYRIVVTSHADHDSNLEVTNTLDYRLAPYPLKINGVAHPYSSLIYVVKGTTDS